MHPAGIRYKARKSRPKLAYAPVYNKCVRDAAGKSDIRHTIHRIEISQAIVSPSRVKPFNGNVRGICIAATGLRRTVRERFDYFRIFTAGSGICPRYFNNAKWCTVSYLHDETDAVSYSRGLKAKRKNQTEQKIHIVDFVFSYLLYCLRIGFHTARKYPAIQSRTTLETPYDKTSFTLIFFFFSLL
jgi:hypothetical protein